MTHPAALRLRSITLREANRFLATVDDRQRPVRRHKFAIALEGQDGALQGVAIAGPPSTRSLDTGCRLEIVRVATDGTPGASTLLFRGVAHAGAAVGYRRADIHTYATASQDEEALRAAGWVPVTVPGPTKNDPGHPDTDRDPSRSLTRWHAAAPTIAGRRP